MRSLSRILLLFIAALPAAAIAVAQQPEQVAATDGAFAPPPLDRYDELIGVLMSPQERAAWKRLRSMGARRAFIEQFWESRDPTPGTAANEFRDIFLQRASRAAKLYSEGTIPGYATDRGRVLLVYGLPDEQEYRALPPGTEAPEVTWRFKQLPTPVRFVAQGDRFVVEVPPVLDQPTFLKSAETELRLPLVAAVGSRRKVPPSTAAGAAVKRTVDVPPEVQIWMQMVFGTAQGRQQIGLSDRVDFFPASAGTYTVLGFELDPDDLGYAVAPPPAPPASAASVSETATTKGKGPGAPLLRDAAGYLLSPLVARCTRARLVEEGLLPAPPPAPSAPPATPAPIPAAALKLFGAVLRGEPGHENTVHQFIVPFCVPAPSDREPAASAREPAAGDREPPPPSGRQSTAPQQGLFRSTVVTLPPGTYRLAWGVYDEVTGHATTRDQTIEVPDFAAAGLRLSSVVVARPPHRDDAVPIRTDRVYPGIRLGSVLMSDDIERLVDRNQTIEVVVIVSGWQSDPNAPGKPRLQVGYRILEPGSGNAARIQAQILDFQVLGQQIPLRQVDMLQPGGTYDVEVRVRDLVGGTEVSTTVPLRIRSKVADQGTTGKAR